MLILISSIHERAAYRVVLVRHGEGEANARKIISGWFNADLTPYGKTIALRLSNLQRLKFHDFVLYIGEEEARGAGVALKKLGYEFDVGHSSMLSMASKTLDIILDELNQSTIDKRQTWRLNTRHSGFLAGVGLSDAYEAYGKEQVRKCGRQVASCYYRVSTYDG